MNFMDSDEILLINKPKGITSFDVIRILRRQTGIRKMGHAGTLDPLASGLMIIGIQKGTKKLNEFLKLPKTYKAEVLLGRKTTTADMEGEILEEKNVEKNNLKDLEDVVTSLKGKISLPVPIYSAIKRDGVPLYKYARKGKDVEIPVKEMEILEINLLDHYKEENYYVLVLEISVSSGTYIRSIAEEIGKRLGLPATLKNLQRTRIGQFTLEQSKELDTN